MAPFVPFLILPVIELIAFILVWMLVGFLNALGLVLLGSLAGGLLLRHYGLASLQRVKSQLDNGGRPESVRLDGLWLAAAGFLLLIPGFVTDLVAAALLVPPLRRAIIHLALIAVRGLQGRWRGRRRGRRSSWASSESTTSPPPPPPPSIMPRGPIIDVEFEDIPPDPPSRR